MTNDEAIREIKDLIIRTKGTSNVLAKPDIKCAQRKLQGIHDKLNDLLYRLSTEEKDDSEKLVERIKEIKS